MESLSRSQTTRPTGTSHTLPLLPHRKQTQARFSPLRVIVSFPAGHEAEVYARRPRR